MPAPHAPRVRACGREWGQRGAARSGGRGRKDRPVDVAQPDVVVPVLERVRERLAIKYVEVRAVDHGHRGHVAPP